MQINSKLRLFDIAVNLTDDQFYGMYHHQKYHKPDYKDVLKRASDIGCEHLLISSGCLSDLKKTRELCQLSPNYYTTAGIHPCRAYELNKDYYGYMGELKDQLELALKEKKLVAIGECGLDYDRLGRSTKQEQMIAFDPHFDLAEKYKLPMYLHNRNTRDDFYDIMQKNRHRIVGGVVHSFTGPLDELQKILHLDLYVGVNGCSLKTQENINVAKQIPLDKLLLETDAPYCEIKRNHPSSKYVKTQFQAQFNEKWKEGQLVKSRNEPCKIIQVLEVMSELLKVDQEKLSEICFQNTLKCFGLA
ncbi:unnamed protein product (macronuclear) [Paramecium tetraurelia]|uniref:Uncharacterized protein n=1 Tax=Paramecium tetraurelia TaxID=5888 RepID=A0C9I2_PARTE|nr:uncharacterized protein GSPATT00006755001 [Paramecium tetraurelia]CAK67449.1 unnamed protein product [Paramecium tetraurelia]|eukprot:XP_001434846.1 hypothetical protein (macronuclear) [Paramecium tetraurelia strain d4-2]